MHQEVRNSKQDVLNPSLPAQPLLPLRQEPPELRDKTIHRGIGSKIASSTKAHTYAQPWTHASEHNSLSYSRTFLEYLDLKTLTETLAKLELAKKKNPYT